MGAVTLIHIQWDCVSIFVGVAVGQYEDSKRGFLDQVKDKTVQRFNEDST
jgi:hypothetical protein